MTLRYRPAAGSHAIDVCTVAVRFAATTPPEAFDRIRALAAKLALENDLPATEQLALPPQLMNIIGFQLPQMPVGVVFRRFAPNGQAEVDLRCEPSAVTLQVRKYEGWTKLMGVLDSTLIQLVPEYLTALPAITGVSIQYDDRFLGGPVDEVGPASDLFREGSPWVTVYDRSTTEQWHSHFGIFIREAAEGRELINVNVSVNDQQLDEGLERVVSLTLLVAESFDIPGQSPLIVSQEEGATAVRNLLVRARARHEQIIEEVLSDTYLQAINFKKSKR